VDQDLRSVAPFQEGPISFRPVEMDDLEFLYQLRHQNSILKESMQSKPFTLESHTKWFVSKVNSPFELMWVVYFNQDKAGLIRASQIEQTNTYRVSVAISETHRNLRLASTSLNYLEEQLLKRLDEVNLLAEVKRSNYPSQMLFLKAKYILRPDVIETDYITFEKSVKSKHLIFRFKIIFDLSDVSGLGHAMRAITLAQEIKKQGHQPVLVPLGKVDSWINRELEALNSQTSLQDECDVVIIDSYDKLKTFEDEILSSKLSVNVIDDFTPLRNTSMQFSPLYDLALIRESVRHLSKFGVNPVLGKYRVLMIPGSGVTSLQLKKLVARFLETNPHVELGIVAFPFASQFPEIQFIEPGENIYSSIHSFHAVVTSAGVTMIEVAFLGFPMAVFVSADNQVAQYEEFKAKNLIFPLGDIREKSFDIGYFSNFLADYDKWCAASKESLSNIDGLGAKRVIDGIITKLHDL